MKTKMMVILMILALIGNYGIVNATEEPGKNVLQSTESETDEVLNDESEIDTEDENDVDSKDKKNEDETDQEHKNRMDNFKNERKLNENEKELQNSLEDLLDDETIDEDVVNNLQSQIDELERQAAEIRANLRQIVQANYNQEELNALEKLKKDLEKDDSIEVIDVDSIISNGNMFKFDTPPVIKDGRTLVPVRAIAEGFQSNVTWIQEEQKVVIEKDNTTIELVLGEEKALINGQVIELDTKAMIMNNRTMVPLRFIGEALGVTVQWNPIDRTIEIVDETKIAPVDPVVNDPITVQ